MRNFNPLFNSLNMTRSTSPFVAAGSSISTRAIPSSGGLMSKLGGGKFTLSGMLNGVQKAIGTVNQIVPIYNQIKPMIQNSKVLLNVAKGIKGDGSTSQRGLFASRRKNRYMWQPSTNFEQKENKLEETTKDIQNNNSPSKPFFV